MTLTQLRYIVALAREGHFGRAARACFVSQPTLSVAVRKFEDELELMLFERHSNHVAPTDAGRRVIAQAEKVLEEANRVQELARAGRDQLKGELRIGAIFTVGPYVLPHVVPHLRELAPEMPLVIEENYTHRLGERLRRSELDAVLLSLPYAEQGICTWPVYEEDFSVLLPADHRLAKVETLQPGDLAGENMLLLGDGHCFRDQVLAACPECAPPVDTNRPARTTEGSSLETIGQMVASGLGVTVVPVTSTDRWRDMRDQERLIREKSFEGDPPRRTIAIAWRETFPRPRAIQALHRAVRAAGLDRVRYLEDAKPVDSDTGAPLSGWLEAPGELTDPATSAG